MTLSMRRLVAAMFVTALLATPATAHTGTPLTRVAETAGHAHAWSTSASEVTQSRAGASIALRDRVAGRDPDARAMEGARTGTVIIPLMTGRVPIAAGGTAPASVPVSLTLAGSIARDTPDVSSRRIAQATVATTFHATLDVAPAMSRASAATAT